MSLPGSLAVRAEARRSERRGRGTPREIIAEAELRVIEHELRTGGITKPKERAVMCLYVASLGRPTIARRLRMSDWEVRWAIDAVRRRLGLGRSGLHATATFQNFKQRQR
jgi:hypothetical protein